MIINSGQFKSYANLYYIGDKQNKRFLYKYIDIDSAIKSLKDGTIRFVQPSEWPDKYENRFYNADYRIKCKKNSDRDIMTPRLYASCFSTTSTSEAAWKVYSYGKIGPGSRCAQFKINIARLRRELDKYAKKVEARIYEGLVSYHSDYFITTLHFSTLKGEKNSSYHDYFDDFCLNNYLTLLLLKREAFSYEQELRYFLIPKDQKTVSKYINPPLNWDKIIESIKVDQDCEDDYLHQLKDACHLAGINKDILRFDLYKRKAKHIIIGEKR